MNKLILIINIILYSVTTALAGLSLMNQLNFIAGQIQYPPQALPQIKTSFSLENVMTISIETALQSCQNSFKWERWNCPSSDFLLKSKSESLLLDREDAYVKALTTASILYTITKNCSTGKITGCNTCRDTPYNSYCSDNPKSAEILLREHVPNDFPDNFNGKTVQHNYKAVTNLLEKSLEKQCVCDVLNSNGVCSKEICFQVLKPFEDIATDIRQMYEEGLQLDNSPENSRIMWNNIPLDVLVYVKSSPNYCEPEAILHWNGMRGRQCSPSINGEIYSEEERTRCRHLCHDCGYAVVPKNVITENRCNCKFIWGFQVQCEMCATVQKQYYCY